MEYSILIEWITDGSLAADYYYAHIPSLDLTTHGRGIDGARQAATELLLLWIAEKRANHEPIPAESDSYYSRIVVDDALLSA